LPITDVRSTVDIHSSLLQMLDLLFEYVDLSMTQFCPDKGKIEELEDYYMVSIHPTTMYCL